MRFVTFRHDGRTRAGRLEGETGAPDASVVDLARPEISCALRGVAPDLRQLVESGLCGLAKRLSSCPIPDAARIPLGEVEIKAPLPRPRRIIGVAHNYRSALAERGMEPPDRPVVFEKDPTTVIGPGESIVLTPELGGVTYEAEVAAVIGTRAESVPAEEALTYVAGYTIFNDVSASEIIRADGDFLRGKNFATFGPMGPYLTTPDEVGDPAALDVTLEVGGRILQQGSTSDMLFGIAELLSILSHQGALEAGDVIATGTPAGVAPLRSPPTWLRPGSVVTVEIGGLGILSNPVEERVHANA